MKKVKDNRRNHAPKEVKKLTNADVLKLAEKAFAKFKPTMDRLK